MLNMLDNVTWPFKLCLMALQKWQFARMPKQVITIGGFDFTGTLQRRNGNSRSCGLTRHHFRLLCHVSCGDPELHAQLHQLAFIQPRSIYGPGDQKLSGTSEIRQGQFRRKYSYSDLSINMKYSPLLVHLQPAPHSQLRVHIYRFLNNSYSGNPLLRP